MLLKKSKKQKISIKKKIGLVILGIFLALFLLEIGLRIEGFVISSLQERRNRISLQEKADYRILCLGESNTAPAGKFSYPGDEYNYPNQLEEILNEKSKEKKIVIINEGKWAIDSTYILEHLKENLNKYNPDIVTVMMGGNERPHPQHSALSYEGKVVTENKSFLENFKTYKLINLLRENKNIPTNSFTKTNNLKEEEEKILRLGRRCKLEEKFEEAERYFEEAIKINPTLAFGAYLELGDCYRIKKEYEKAEKILKKAIKEINSGGKITDKSNYKWFHEVSIKYEIYFKLAQCYSEQEKYKEAETVTKEGIKAKFKEIVESCPILYHNYQELQKIINKREILLVVIGYPTFSIDPLKKTLESNKTIFVDNEKIFKDGSYDEFFVDRFAGDFGHCTKKGNKLLAENIADAILNKFFNE